jgi:alpha-1,3-mannosyltransferase
MLFAHVALSMLARRRFLLGSLLFSLSVSIKMNSLLALPALGLVLLRNVGMSRTAGILIACIVLQAVLAYPFLATHPASYLSKAFEFSRVFSFQWTVNWKFLSEEMFVSPGFAQALLGMHVFALLYFSHRVWLARDGGLIVVIYKICAHELESFQRDGILSFVCGDAGGVYHDGPAFIVEIVWSCVFVGVAFARTLHFQFYAWYFHSLPFLLWRGAFVPPTIPRIFVQLIPAAGISKPIHMERLQSARAALETALRVAVLFSVEYAFTAVDRSPGPDGRPRGEPLPSSSFVLQAAHFLILAGLALRVSGDKK